MGRGTPATAAATSTTTALEQSKQLIWDIIDAPVSQNPSSLLNAATPDNDIIILNRGFLDLIQGKIDGVIDADSEIRWFDNHKQELRDYVINYKPEPLSSAVSAKLKEKINTATTPPNWDAIKSPLFSIERNPSYIFAINALKDGFEKGISLGLTGSPLATFTLAYSSSLTTYKSTEQLIPLSSTSLTQLSSLIDFTDPTQPRINNPSAFERLISSNPQEVVAISLAIQGGIEKNVSDTTEFTQVADAFSQKGYAISLANELILDYFRSNPAHVHNYPNGPNMADDKARFIATLKSNPKFKSVYDALGAADQQAVEAFIDQDYDVKFGDVKFGKTLRTAGLVDIGAAALGALGLTDLGPIAASLISRNGASRFIPTSSMSEQMLSRIDTRLQAAQAVGNFPMLNGYQGDSEDIAKFVRTSGLEGNVELILPLTITPLHQNGELQRELREAYMKDVDLSMPLYLLHVGNALVGAFASNQEWSELARLRVTRNELGLSPTLNEDNPWIPAKNKDQSDAGQFLDMTHYPDMAVEGALARTTAVSAQNAITDTRAEFGPSMSLILGAALVAIPWAGYAIPGAGWDLDVGKKNDAYEEDVQSELTDERIKLGDLQAVGMQTGTTLLGLAFSFIAMDSDGSTDQNIHGALAQATGVLNEPVKTQITSMLIHNTTGNDIQVLPLALTVGTELIREFRDGADIYELGKRDFGENSTSNSWDKAQTAIVIGLKLVETAEGIAVAAIMAQHAPEEDKGWIIATELLEVASFGLGVGIQALFDHYAKKRELVGKYLVWNPDEVEGSLLGGSFARDKANWGIKFNPSLAFDPDSRLPVFGADLGLKIEF